MNNAAARRTALSALTILSAPLQPPAASAIEKPSAVQLGVASADSGVVAAGREHTWQCSLRTGQRAEIKLRAAPFRISATLSDPTNRERLRWRSVDGSGTLTMTWVADVQGTWQVTFSASDSTTNTPYHVRLDSLRTADSTQIAASRFDFLHHDALLAIETGDVETALRYCGDALDAASAQGESVDVAQRLEALGYRFAEAGADSAAIALVTRGIQIREQATGVNDPQLAGPLEDLATIYCTFGRDRDAVAPQQRALRIRLAHFGEEHPLVARSRRDLAIVYFGQAQYAAADSLLRLARATYRTHLPDSLSIIAEVECYLAETCRVRNRYEEAEDLFLHSLQLARQAYPGDDPNLATYLINLSGFYRDLARYDEAERLQEEALRIRQAAGLESELPTPTLNLAELYRFQSRYEDAETLYLSALELARRHLPDVDVTVFHNQLATLYSEVGKAQEAETEYRQALAILAASPHASSFDLAQTEHDLGTLLSHSSRFQEAEALFQSALKRREAAVGPFHPLVAMTCVSMARSIQRDPAGDRAKALQLLDRAVQILDASDVEPEAGIDAYSLRAELRWSAADSAGALNDLTEAIDLVERLRPYRGGGTREKVSFLGRHKSLYDRMVAWQVMAGAPQIAFDYAERIRARVLEDELARNRNRHSLGAVPSTPMAIVQDSLRTALVDCQERVRFLQTHDSLTDPEEAELAALLKRRDQLAVAYQRAYDRSVALASAQPPATGEQAPTDPLQAFQQSDVPLLAYSIGEDGAYLFFVPAPGGRVEAFPLHVSSAAAAALNTTAGPVTRTSIEVIVAGDAHKADPAALGLVLGLKSKRGIALAQETSDASPAPLFAQLHALFEVLVPPSVWARIRGAANIVIVPDAALHVLPFEALVVDIGTPGTDPIYFLDHGPAIRYVPSARVLKALSDRSGGYVTERPLHHILSVTDPIYAPHDEHASAWTNTDSHDQELISYATFAQRGGSLAPLPGAREESAAITRAFSPQRVQVIHGLAADEETVRAALPGKQAIHFATHGLVEQGRSELLAALALTPPPRSGLRLDNDGLLQLFEVYQLQIAASLVVLSACQSSVGSVAPGEGVLALSRGFIAAGAQRVVASLWAVDDESTALLMGDFFGRLARDEDAGQAYDFARALHDAKLALRRNHRWMHPYYWAGFTLSGLH